MSATHRITHHPDEELLVSYASGAADEAFALVVATHLAFCPQCRRVVSAFERTGGAMLETLAPAAMKDDALARTLARLDEPAPVTSRPPVVGDGRVPEPLRSYVGSLDKSWLPLGPGVAHRPLMKRGRTTVRLIRALPGASVPVHSHEGRELTLVLTGGFHDETGQFGPGDLESATPETRHKPVADPGDVCINLALTDAPLRFFSVLPRLVGKVFGI
jgi:putative transcriptional regulator